MARKDEIEPGFKLLKYGIVALVACLLLFSTVYTIPAGERGVLLTFGKPDMDVRDEGLHFKAPIVQTIKKMEVRTQKIETTSDSASRDLQDVQTKIALNFHLSPSEVPNLYQEVGFAYKERIIDPSIEESVKAVTAKYTAAELITKRPAVRTDMQALISEKLSPYYIKVDGFNIVDFQFSEEFDKAIEQKVTAEQLMLKAEMDLERIIIEKEQKITQAEGEAEALRLQKAQVTDALVELRRIELDRFGLEVQQEAIAKWNGALPTVTGGAVPFFNIATE